MRVEIVALPRFLPTKNFLLLRPSVITVPWLLLSATGASKLWNWKMHDRSHWFRTNVRQGISTTLHQICSTESRTVLQHSMIWVRAQEIDDGGSGMLVKTQ